MSFRKIQRKVQPPKFSNIDWSNSLTHQLAFLYNGSDITREAVTNNVAQRGSTVVEQVSNNGVAISSNGLSISATFPHAPIITSDGSGTGDFTLFFFGAAPNAGARSAPIAQTSASRGNQVYLLANTDVTITASAGAMAFLAYDSTIGVSGVATSTGVDDNYHMWIGVRQGTTYTLYRDGISVASGTSGISDVYAGGEQVTVGGLYSYTTFNCGYPIILTGSYNRALSYQEVQSLTRNPWQLYIPQKTPIFVPISISGDATALGIIAAATAEFLAGSASGQVNATATGVTINATAELLAGTASGSTNATASGSLLEAVTSYLAGTASGSAVASGIILDAVSVFIPGSASGNSGATAPGALLEAISSFLSGTATADVLVTGVTITATAEFLPGAASGGSNATATGMTASATTSLLAGTASGEVNATATGVIVNAISTLLGGSASGNVVGTSVPSDRISISISISI